jgi:ABC-type multidrug transport system fused ATPase/permease subunit
MGASQRTLDLRGTGRLVNLLATDTWHTGDAISLFVGLVINLCSIAVFSLLLMALSWKLTILVAAGVAIVSAVIQIVTASARRLGQEGVQANAILSGHMLDALDGIREIQMFGLRAHRQEIFEMISKRVKSVYFRLDLLHRAVAPLSEVLYVGLLLGLLLIGVRSHGAVPNIIVFMLVLYRLQPQIRQLDAARLSLVSLTTPVDEVLSFSCENSAAEETGATVPGLRRGIEFEDVSFSYGDEFDFKLDHVSFTIPAGTTTAIVGRSGSGKSTLIRLLCRFYEPENGAIYADGKPLAETNMRQWREQIAWVGQDAHLFRASVFDNIRYGRISASPEEVVAAAVLSGADAFIRQLPDGYQTNIGGGGVELSSGQVQRLALARAFVRKASILILDEATNALDSLSEDFIQERLLKIAGGHTVIVISHRLSTMKNADQVMVIEGGRITEQGTPAQLSKRRGLFARMRELQHVDF